MAMFQTVSHHDDDEDEDDRPPMTRCVMCGAEFVSFKLWVDTCSEKCEKAMDDLEARTGYCSWCGRPGPIGKSCIRTVPGTSEKDECGQFG